MAQYETMKTVGGVRTAAIDEGLRTHMNRVYGTMSVGMLITALAAWAISGLATTTDVSQAAAQLGNGKLLTSFGTTIYSAPLSWIIMFSPLAFIFGLSAMINRMSAATAQIVFYALSCGLPNCSNVFLVSHIVSVFCIWFGVFFVMCVPYVSYWSCVFCGIVEDVQIVFIGLDLFRCVFLNVRFPQSLQGLIEITTE